MKKYFINVLVFINRKIMIEISEANLKLKPIDYFNEC
jgi:hypothetical protein